MYGFHHKSILVSAVLCCICICFVNFVPLASAADFVSSEDTIEETVDTSNPDPEPIIIEVNNSQDTSDLVLTDFSTSIVTIDADNTTGFKSVVLGLIGSYDLVTKEYTYTGNNGYTQKQVTTESDYAWIISAGIFALVLYCLFRLMGGVLCGRK